ncbi:MAG TPA: hypothetical protein VL282_02420 [Tepidisphaeraceae bacterium]|jgi:hypothetical protein|nr:hypothetical protein [Tepidisphaeraceae bacterium]
MGMIAKVGIGVAAIVVVFVIVLLVQKFQAHRQERRSSRIKDRLRRRTKPVPITGPASMNPRTSEE